MASLWRKIVCWIFGECWQIDESKRRIDGLQARVARLERDVQYELGDDRPWRPSDAFRTR